MTSLKDGYIEMGSSGLMLNVITPLQKFSKGGTTISDVLRQRFEDLFHRTISSHTLTQVENVYTGKKEVIKIQWRPLYMPCGYRVVRNSDIRPIFGWYLYNPLIELGYKLLMNIPGPLL